MDGCLVCDDLSNDLQLKGQVQRTIGWVFVVLVRL